METNKLIAGIVAAAIAIIVLAGVLMPALSNATTTEDKFTNEGYNRYTSIESSDDTEITIVWDHTKPDYLTVNGEDIELTIMSTYTSLVFGQSFTFRIIHTSSFVDIQLIGADFATYLQASTTNGYDLDITAQSGTLTATVNEVSKTQTYTTLYYPDPDGSYIMKKSDEAAYVLPDSTVIVANGITNVDGAGRGIYFTGSVDDGYSFSYYRLGDNTATVDNVVSNYVEDSAHEDLILLEKITFEMTINTDTQDVTYSYFLVPYEVTAERSVHLSDAMNVILNVIPLLIIVAVLLGVVAVFILRRE